MTKFYVEENEFPHSTSLPTSPQGGNLALLHHCSPPPPSGLKDSQSRLITSTHLTHQRDWCFFTALSLFSCSSLMVSRLAFYNHPSHSLSLSSAHPGLRGSIKWIVFVYSFSLLPAIIFLYSSPFSNTISRDGFVKVSYFYGMRYWRYHGEAMIRWRRSQETKDREKPKDKYCWAFAADTIVTVFKMSDAVCRSKRGEEYISCLSFSLFLIPKLRVDLCSTASRLYALTFPVR